VCRYDLVATIADNKRVCPECGSEFSLSDLLRDRRKGDWNVAMGFRRLVTSLAWRGVVTTIIWAGVAVGVAYLCNLFPFSGRAMGGIALVLVIPGVAVGHALSRNLTEIAGCESILFTTVAVSAAIAVVWAGVALAGVVRPMEDWSIFVVVATSLFAGLWIVRNMHFDG